MQEFLQRTSMLIGQEGINKLSKSKVVILGIGGVGSFVCEALARSGVGSIVLVDKDTVDITNINRQIIATFSTIGKDKVEVMKERIKDINPNCSVQTYKNFISKDNIEDIIDKDVDYVIDAIDTVTSKIAVIVWCKENNINIISAMGAGNKMDCTKFKVADIYQTKVCPLAKVMRKELKKRNIYSLKVVYSEEKPISMEYDESFSKDTRKLPPASIAFVPSVVGLTIASEVIKDIINYENLC